RFSRDWSSDVCSSDLAAMYWIGVMRYTQSGNFSEFTQFGSLWREARANAGTLVTLFIYNLLLGLLLAIISPLAVLTCIGIFVLRSEERRVGKECRCGW